MKLFGIEFDTRPAYLIHLAIIVGILFAGFYIGDKYFNLSKLPTIGMAVFWFIVLYIADSLAEQWTGI